MKRRIFVPTLLAVVLALLPGTAYAKGPLGATVTGPGLAQAIRFGTPEAASELAQQAHLYDGLSNSTVAAAVSAPGGDLGPRYVAEYQLAGPDDPVEVRQELYPFAEGGAVTYTPPGQRPFGSEKPSSGGWFAAGSALTELLVAAGVPAPAGAVVAPPRLAG